MPLPKKWHKNKKHKAPPEGFEIIEPTLEALEHELRDKIQESNLTKRKTESVWPVHQINWQKSRYVYDMFYTYHKISREVYQYCITQKYIDAALIAKWKKPGYERLCSTYVINPTNYKFGTTSICRVPYWDRSPEQKMAQDPTTGCLGCASGKGAGPKNIFGNKYGQYLAAVQIARENRMEQKRQQQKQKAQEEKAAKKNNNNDSDDDDDDETDDGSSDDDDDDDDDNEDDYGPQPVAGIWAGSQKLQNQSEQMMEGDDGEEETDDEEEGDDNDDDDDEEGPPLPPPAKKLRQG